VCQPFFWIFPKKSKNIINAAEITQKGEFFLDRAGAGWYIICSKMILGIAGT
jgi:hypothetical protein